MKHWKTSCNPKVHKREVVRKIHLLNKNIYNDSIWKGRFIVRLRGCPQINWYSDHSGFIYKVCYEFYDKKTHKVYVHYGNSNTSLYELDCIMNNFIIEKCRVWQEISSPYELAEDFRNK